jgi:nucleotide-binding universal stress UspA family protein
MALRILLGVDGSGFAEAARDVVLQLHGTNADCQVTALHIVNVRAPTGNLIKDLTGRMGFEPAVVRPEVEQAYLEEGAKLLDSVVSAAKARNLEVETCLEQGAVGERLAHHARHADLVVLGLRGETEERFPGQGGSVIEGMMSSVAVPILFVPSNAHQITGITLGFDGSEGAAHALTAVRVLTAAVTVPVHAIYVSEDGSGGEHLSEVADNLPGVDVHTEIVTDEEPHSAIVRHASKVGANVIAVGFRGRSKIKDFLYGSAVDWILMNSHAMVLVAH